MRITKLLIGLVSVSLFLLPTMVSAHGGHETARAEQVKVGPYNLLIESNIWPIKAQSNVDLVITTDLDRSEIVGYARLMPVGDSTVVKSRVPLGSHASLPNALTYHNFTVPAAGDWYIELDVTGPQGKATGRTETFTVEGPPGMPLWVGWSLAYLPIAGFIWFLTREFRQIRRSPAQA
jgi:hypothetical protein